MARSRIEQRSHLPEVIRLERLEEDADRFEEYQQGVAARQRESIAQFEQYQRDVRDQLRKLEVALEEKLTALEEKGQQSKTIAIAILSSVCVSVVLLALNLGLGK